MVPGIVAHPENQRRPRESGDPLSVRGREAYLTPFRPLAQIAWQVAEGQKEVRPPEPSAWWNYPVSKDVVVEVRCDSSPWRLKQVRSLIAQMILQLNENEKKDHARCHRPGQLASVFGVPGFSHMHGQTGLLGLCRN
jgi:hypothetical protein